MMKTQACGKTTTEVDEHFHVFLTIISSMFDMFLFCFRSWNLYGIVAKGRQNVKHSDNTCDVFAGKLNTCDYDSLTFPDNFGV